MSKRFYLDAPLKEKQSVILPKDQMHHLIRVMRIKEGEHIEIVNGTGYLAKAVYDGNLTITSVELKQKNPIEKTLVLAHSEPKHIDMVLEKATELGIDHFILFASKKSKISVFSTNKQERHQKILVSALKQSQRLYLPSITYLKGIDDLDLNKNYLLADFEGTTFTPIQKSSAFIIGPESGFTKEEITYIKTNLQAKGILLSNNVLRTETAAITASVLLSL